MDSLEPQAISIFISNSKTAEVGMPRTAKNPAAIKPEKVATTTRRDIPGNLPYLTASGTLKKALDRAIDAQRPDKFNADFLENVLKLRGGSAKATVPILKKMGFLTSDGTPTELYAKFRTTSGRGYAALQGMRNAFAEIFRRSEYAHSVDDAKLKDIVVEITGLKASEPVTVAIRGTFNVLKSYIPSNIDLTAQPDWGPAEEVAGDKTSTTAKATPSTADEKTNSDIRLAYNINIVLPETSDLNVLNAIFRSIKENLMR